ncbi:MAG TPA: hypothetical protein VFS09_00030 [Candidatus Eisenbacteria bacterium]|nr:hypothetical protein [Candidatus Eisenbacteria bacterium]
MSEPSSRREFLRTMSLAGATAAIAGIAGCSAETQEVGEIQIGDVDVDKEGRIVITDQDLIKQLDTQYHAQERRGKAQKNDTLGFKVTFVVTTPTGDDCPGNHTVNSLCGC